MAEFPNTNEVDLNFFFKRINLLIRKSILNVFRAINFLFKNWIKILFIGIIGIAYGYYSDISATKIYKNEGIVIPNFGSVDYLYGTIDELNTRIKRKDTVFLKNILGNNYKALRKVDIEAVADVNHIVTSRDQIDIYRVLYQNKDFEEFASNAAINKNFKYHRINFTIKGEGISQQVIKDILDYWNNNEHFKDYEKIYVKNTELEIAERQKMITQVDSIINSLGVNRVHEGAGINISNNGNMHLLLTEKSNLLEQLREAEIKLSDYSSPIKLVYMDYEVEIKGLPSIIKYPIILIGLFSLFFFLRYLYRQAREYSYRED